MTHRDEQLDENLQRTVEALARLTPAKTGLSRDEMLFRAGRASAGRIGGLQGGRIWPAVSVLLATGLAVSLAARPAVREIERVVIVERPAEPAAPQAGQAHVYKPTQQDDDDAWAAGAGRAEYLAMRNKVLEHGLDALPVANGGERWAGPDEQRRMVRELLDGGEIRSGAPGGAL